MKHQPFESWIFMQETIDAAQQSELKEHLMACEQCSVLSDSWMAIEGPLSQAEILLPADGFRTRWRMRLSAQQLNRQKKQISILFGALSAGAAIVFLPLAASIFLLILSPEDLLFGVIRDAIEWFGWLGFVGGLLSTIVESLLDTIPPLAWLGFLLLISLLSWIWLSSVHQLNRRARIERSTTR